MAILKNNKKVIIIGLFMLLAFIAVSLVPDSLSRYKKNKYGSGQISIAQWDVSATSNNSNINLVAGQETTYTFTAHNDSDVTVNYSVEVSNLPQGVQVKIDSGSYVTPTNNKVTFSNVGELGFTGTTQRSHTLTFNTPLSTSEVSNQSVGVEVTFAQKIN